MSTEWTAIGALEKHESEMGLPREWTCYQIFHTTSGESGTKVYVDPGILRPLLEKYADEEVISGDDYGPITGTQALGILDRATHLTEEDVHDGCMTTLANAGRLR